MNTLLSKKGGHVGTDLNYLISYLRAQAYHANPIVLESPSPVVTISRQRGALGTAIAHRAAELLSAPGGESTPWIVVDRSLAQRVIEDHHLSEEISRYLTEEQTLSIRETVEEMLGLQSARWTAVEKMTQTMLHLAELGRVILVGRAANIVTARHPCAYHVRVIGSVDLRIHRVMEETGLLPKQAEALVHKSDEDRAEFVSRYFRRRVNDVAAYDLVLNTDHLGVDKAARLVADLVMAK